MVKVTKVYEQEGSPDRARAGRKKLVLTRLPGCTEVPSLSETRIREKGMAAVVARHGRTGTDSPLYVGCLDPAKDECAERPSSFT